MTRTLALGVVLTFLPSAAFAQSVIGVLGIAREVAPIEQQLQDSREIVVRGYVFRTGTLGSRKVVVGRSGVGKVNAAIVTTLMIDHFNPIALLFSGTAGGVDPSLLPGDVVIGAVVAQHDFGLETPDGMTRRGLRNPLSGEREEVLVPAPEALLEAARRSKSSITMPTIKTPEGGRSPRIIEGVIVTGDVFMAHAPRRDELRRSLGAAAVEMEGAAVVQVCRQFAVPCLVVRSITDRADARASTSYDEFIAVASENAGALVTAIIARLENGVR